jgi:hypothetical protein
MTTAKSPHEAQVGDWIEERGLHSGPSRRGQIVELLGREGHEHYHVRWDEQHESIVYPTEGVLIIPQPRPPATAHLDEAEAKPSGSR